jgi:outer membrane immunogenic protein
MNKIIALSAAAAALATVAGAALPAAAQSTTTGSIGWTDHSPGDANLNAITGRVTWTGGYFGVEGEVSGGVGNDTVNVAGTDVKVKLKDQAAVYGVAKMPLGNNLDVFARVGYGTTRVSGSAFGASAKDSENSWNYGVGGDYFFDGKNGIRADYTYEDFTKNGVGHADVWGLGYVRKF